MQTDTWCPNCMQMVSPRRNQKILEFISSLLVAFAVGPWLLPSFGVGDWLGQPWFIALQWIMVITGAISALPITRSCPICKTAKLEKKAPAH